MRSGKKEHKMERTKRVNQQGKREIGKIIQRELGDRRLELGTLTT